MNITSAWWWKMCVLCLHLSCQCGMCEGKSEGKKKNIQNANWTRATENPFCVWDGWRSKPVERQEEWTMWCSEWKADISHHWIRKHQICKDVCWITRRLFVDFSVYIERIRQLSAQRILQKLFSIQARWCCLVSAFWISTSLLSSVLVLHHSHWL